MKVTVLVFMSLFLLEGCGKQKVDIDIKDDLPEEIIIKHELDLNIDELKLLFTTGCEEKFDTETEINECIEKEVAAILSQISQFLDTQKENEETP